MDTQDAFRGSESDMQIFCNTASRWFHVTQLSTEGQDLYVEFDVPGVGHCRKLLKKRSPDLRERRQTKPMEEKGPEAHLDETYGRPKREFGEWMRELALRQIKTMEEKGSEAHLDEADGRPEIEFGEWMRELVLRQQMLRADSYMSPEIVSQVGSFAPATSSHNVGEKTGEAPALTGVSH